jgi:hypothetical protein
MRNVPVYSAVVTTRHNDSNRILRIARRISVLYDSHKETAITSITALGTGLSESKALCSL